MWFENTLSTVSVGRREKGDAVRERRKGGEGGKGGMIGHDVVGRCSTT